MVARAERWKEGQGGRGLLAPCAFGRVRKGANVRLCNYHLGLFGETFLDFLILVLLDRLLRV